MILNTMMRQRTYWWPLRACWSPSACPSMTPRSSAEDWEASRKLFCTIQMFCVLLWNKSLYYDESWLFPHIGQRGNARLSSWVWAAVCSSGRPLVWVSCRRWGRLLAMWPVEKCGMTLCVHFYRNSTLVFCFAAVLKKNLRTDQN